MQINIAVPNALIKRIDEMMEEDGLDNRSAFVRRLIRLEIRRRQNLKKQAEKNIWSTQE